MAIVWQPNYFTCLVLAWCSSYVIYLFSLSLSFGGGALAAKLWPTSDPLLVVVVVQLKALSCRAHVCQIQKKKRRKPTHHHGWSSSEPETSLRKAKDNNNSNNNNKEKRPAPGRKCKTRGIYLFIGLFLLHYFVCFFFPLFCWHLVPKIKDSFRGSWLKSGHCFEDENWKWCPSSRHCATSFFTGMSVASRNEWILKKYPAQAAVTLLLVLFFFFVFDLVGGTGLLCLFICYYGQEQQYKLVLLWQ